MFVELNTLQYILVHAGDGPERHARELVSLAAAGSVVVLVPPAARVQWKVSLPKVIATLPWESTYVFDVQGNVRRALEELDGQPFQTVFVSSNPEEVAGAACARLSTLLVGDRAPQALPDLWCADFAEAGQRLLDFKAGRRVSGYAGELHATLPRSGARPGGVLVWLPDRLDEDLRPTMSLLVLGRYFPTADARRPKHQPSMRLYQLKTKITSGRPVLPGLAAALRIVADRRPVAAVTVVPPRPGRPAPPLARLVEEACRDGDVNLSFAPEMLRCVRDYPQQKAAGGFTARRANVEGVFREGSHVPRGHAVIVDDIWTSGSTVMACARQLLSAGATFVTAVSLAIDQAIVLSALEPVAIPCREPACDGTLSLRFNGQTQHGFWGCSEFFGVRHCRGGLPWAEGLRAMNERNTRDLIEDSPDIRF